MSAWLSRGRRREADAASAFSAASELAFRPWSEAALELRAVVADDGAPARAQGPVDLTLHRGELAALVHPAALGLAAIAAGLARPGSGEVRWFGEPIAGLRPGALARRRRGRIGYLPAEPDLASAELIASAGGAAGSGTAAVLAASPAGAEPTATAPMAGEPAAGDARIPASAAVIPHLTVLENLLLPAVATRSVPESLERADALLEQFGLAGVARDRAGVLDVPQRRRLALARVLLPAPTVVVAVEPDAATEAVLAERAANGLAVLVARTAPVEG